MSDNNRFFTLDRVVKGILFIGLAVGAVWLLGYLSDVLIPFTIAFLLAYLINPLVSLINRKIKSRALSVFLSLACVILVIAGLFAVIIPLIVGEFSHMGKILHEIINNSDISRRASEFLPADLWKSVVEYASREEVQEFFKADNFWKIAETAAKKLLPGIWGFLSGAANIILGFIGLFVIVLYLVFLLIDYKKVSEAWQDLLPVKYRPMVTGFVNDFESGMNRYFRAQALVAFIVGVLFAIGFSIIGLPMGILLGFFIGLLNMVPYLQIVGLIPAFLFSLFHALETGSDLGLIIGLTCMVFVIVQIIQDALLTPRIMGKVTGLSPAMILLSLSVWGKLLGVFGLVIALPMTCLLYAYFKQFLKVVNDMEQPEMISNS